jgi:hypothetical protein
MLIGRYNFTGVDEIKTPPAPNLTLWRQYFPNWRRSAFSKPAIRVFAAVNQDIPDCEE